MSKIPCPACGKRASVINTNNLANGETRRFYKCPSCGYQFTTLEQLAATTKEVQRDTEVTVQSFQTIGVKHLATGKVYKSVKEAATKLHLSERSIYNAIQSGKATSIGEFGTVVQYQRK